MNASQRVRFIFVLVIMFFIFSSQLFAMNLAPKGSILLDRVMFDYFIPSLVLGLFGFIFVIIAIIGSETSGGWRSFCVFYSALFIYLTVNFVCWWVLKNFQIPRRELYSIMVFCVTAIMLLFVLVGHLWLKRPKKNPSKTWTCPHCGKVNTFTLTCYECSEPRVIDEGKKKIKG